VKVEPRPAALSTVIVPSIISTKRLVITRPSPVPPYLRVVEASACTNGWKSRAFCSGVIPMPSSSNAIRTPGLPSESSSVTRIRIAPFFVNFAALLRRLLKICRVRIRSANMRYGPLGRRSSSVFSCRASSG
jgi:hypothetical protein